MGSDTPFGDLASALPVWPRWMSISTAARYLDRTEAAMRGLVARAQIPYVKQGERVFFDREALDEWMRSTQRGSKWGRR
jgi:excisionase family DNA binding protein